MRTFLFRLSGLLGLLLALGSGARAQAPNSLPPRLELYLSTNSDTAVLTAPVVVPQVYALSPRVSSQTPPRYDYRQARQVERKYIRARRYYKRLNRRNTREVQQNRLEEQRFEHRKQRQERRPLHVV